MPTRDEFQLLYEQGPDAVWNLLVMQQTQIDTLVLRVKAGAPPAQATGIAR